MKRHAYIDTITAKGKTYRYSRIPGVRRIRLPDDYEAAKETIAKLTGAPGRDEMRGYLRYLVASSKARAKTRGMAHDLIEPVLFGMFVAQNGCCSLTGIPFDIDKVGLADPFLRPFAPSIDRIDSAIGYTIKNSRLICRIANFAMGKWGYDALRKISLAIAAREEQIAARPRAHLQNI